MIACIEQELYPLLEERINNKIAMQLERERNVLQQKFVEKKDYDIKYYKTLEDIDKIKEEITDNSRDVSEKMAQIYARLEKLMEEKVSNIKLDIILDKYAPLRMVERIDERLETFVTKQMNEMTLMGIDE